MANTSRLQSATAIERVENLHFLSPRLSKQLKGTPTFRRGLRVEATSDAQTGEDMQAVVLGHANKKKLGAKSKAIPLADGAERLDGDFAVSGSMIRLQDGTVVLDAYKNDGVWIPVFRLGLLVMNRGVQEDYQELRKAAKKGDIRIRPFGTVSLHSGAALQLAEGQSDHLANIPAEEIFTDEYGRIKGKNMPQYLFSAWGQAAETCTLTRDIDGTLVLIEADEKGDLSISDETGNKKLDEQFDILFRLQQQAKDKAAKDGKDAAKAALPQYSGGLQLTKQT